MGRQRRSEGTYSPPKLRASSCCQVSLMAFLPSKAPGVSAGASRRTFERATQCSVDSTFSIEDPIRQSDSSDMTCGRSLAMVFVSCFSHPRDSAEFLSVSIISEHIDRPLKSELDTCQITIYVKQHKLIFHHFGLDSSRARGSTSQKRSDWAARLFAIGKAPRVA